MAAVTLTLEAIGDRRHRGGLAGGPVREPDERDERAGDGADPDPPKSKRTKGGEGSNVMLTR